MYQWKRLLTMAKVFKDRRSNLLSFVGNADTVFITNNFGGGTEHYANQYINKSNNDILVVRFVEYFRDLYIELNRSGKTLNIPIENLHQIFTEKITTIVVNTLVGCNDIDNVLNQIKIHKEKYGCSIEYMMHDYNAICISCNLFHENKYCGLECRKNGCKLTTPDEKRNIVIDEWRSMWGGFLNIVDQIICFSKSSKNIVIDVYPFLEDKIVVRPHDMSYCTYSHIDTNGKAFHIGFVGDCGSEFKGLKVVQNVIERYSKDIPITIIGPKSKYYKLKGKAKCTGEYKREELMDILDEEKVTHIIFPSLCPETFSYVVSEIIMMDLSIVCFDIGAQAEKVRAYPKGVVVSDEEELMTYIENHK